MIPNPALSASSPNGEIIPIYSAALALVIAHATARNGIPNTPSNPNNT